MANFLTYLSTYNAKASLAISEAAKEGKSEKVNIMSALKSTANDENLSTDVRLNALTALINIGDLLDKPLPPYFPLVSTFANTVTYTGVHNDLAGLDVGQYQHLTPQEKSQLFSKANTTDITWANLIGDYSQNLPFAALFDQKQQALLGTGLVRSTGGTITYDTATYLTTSTFSSIAAGGGLTGFYPNPQLSNSAVTGQALTGFDISAPTGSVGPSDTILTALEKLNANLNAASAGLGTISSVSFAMPSDVFNYTAGPYTSGAAPLSATFKSQSQNLFFAAPAVGGAGVPQFRAMDVSDLPTSGAIAGSYGSSTQIPVVQVDAYGRVTSISNVTSASGGQVNTVTFNVPGGGVFSQTSTGTPADVIINLGLGTQVANTVWAGPASGVDTTPGFRALVAADIPIGISQDKITGLSSSLSGKLGVGLNTSLIFMGNASGVAAQSVIAGDVAAVFSQISGVNTATLTIADKAITYDKFADIPDSPSNPTRPILLGRWSSGQGSMEQITLSGDFTLSGTGEIGLLTPNPPELTDAGDLLTSSGANVLERLSLPLDYSTKGYLLVPYVGTTMPDIKLIWGEALGDITYAIDDTTTPGTPFANFSIGANKVTLGKIAQIADQRILGNISGAAASPAELTGANVVSMLPQFNTTDPGLVPAASITPGPGYTLADYFLNANGGWGLAGGGTVTITGSPVANQITMFSSPTSITNAVAGTDFVAPGDITSSGLTTTSARLLGRYTTSPSPGSVQEITVGASLSLTTGGALGIKLSNANSWSATQSFVAGTSINLGETATATGSAKFYGFSSGYVTLTVASTTNNQTYILPSAYGATGEFLKLVDHTTGELGWAAGGGTPAGSANQFQYNDGGTAFGAVPYMEYSGSGYIYTAANNFSFVDSVSSPTKGVVFDITTITGTGQSWQFPDGGGTFTEIDAAQTLTNKTLSIGTAINISAPDAGTMYYSTDTAGTLTELLTGGAANAGKVLTIDPGGVPYWTGVVASAAGSNTEFQYNSSGSLAGAAELTYTGGFVCLQTPKIGTSLGNGHYHLHRSASMPGGGITDYLTHFWIAANKDVGYKFENDSYASYLRFSATGSDKIYTFPNASGTVMLNAFTKISDGTSDVITASGADTLAIVGDGNLIDATYNNIGSIKAVTIGWLGPNFAFGVPTAGLTYVAYTNTTTSTTISSTGITNGKVVAVASGGGLTSSSTSLTQLNYLSSATGTTGTNTGSIVFDTSPTITNPTITGISLTAGTATKAPLSFASGTSLTTAAAGAMEYDGTVPFFSIAASTRGVLQSQQVLYLGTPYTLTSQTAAQKLFNATANGAVTLPTGTFEFVCFFSLSSMSASSGSFGFALTAGTALIASQGWQSIAQKGIATLSTATAGQLTYSTGANTALTTAS